MNKETIEVGMFSSVLIFGLPLLMIATYLVAN
jgi:hypothetical protein